MSHPDVIRLSRSVVGEQEKAALARVIDHGFLGMGQEVKLFEDELRAYLGGDMHVVCVNTGTSALQLALQGLGIGAGHEVLVPTLTYVASFQAVSATGAMPVACDVREGDGLLDLDDAERRITPRTRAVMPVHYASNPGDLQAIRAFARAHGLRVVEDAAHAFGCSYQGRRIGSSGDVICFSFDGIKNITSGEGGALVTSDPEVAERARDLRLLGVHKDTQQRFAGQRSWEFDVREQGWRYHMSNLFAAIGRAQLARFERDLAPRRRQIAALYRETLRDIAELRWFATHPDAEVIPHIAPVRVLSGRRDHLRSVLQEHRVETGVHYKPNHLLALYRGPSLPVAERLYDELMTLPLHPDLSTDDAVRVADLIRSAGAA